MSFVFRLLSYFWPIRVRQVEGLHGPLDLVWESGRLVLNSARANQSFGSLHDVWQRSFEAIGLRDREPASVLLLGLGAGSVIGILRDELGITAPITAVEHDPVVIGIAKGPPFGVGSRADVEIIEGDAFDVIYRLKGPYDLIVADLFEDRDVPTGLGRSAVLDRFAAILAPHGDLLVNTMVHDEEGLRLRERIVQGLARTGLKITQLRPLPENSVLHGRRQHPSAFP